MCKLGSKECLVGLLAALSVIYAGIIPIFSGIDWNETSLLSGAGIAGGFYLMILITAAIVFGVVKGKKIAYYIGMVYFAVSAAFFAMATSVFLSVNYMIAPAIATIISIVNIILLWLLVKKD